MAGRDERDSETENSAQPSDAIGVRMEMRAALQYALFLGVVTVLVKPAGSYLARVFAGEKTFLDRFLLPIERAIFRVARIDPARRMTAREYTVAFVIFSAVGTLLLYAILRVQTLIPGGPAKEFLSTPLTLDLAMNTAISFSTTTTWQAYGGESTMKYWTQIIGLAAQNFFAGAAGLAIGIAFIRGFANKERATIGNFWFDLVRAMLWVLLPICVAGSIVLIFEGVPMTFGPYVNAHALGGGIQVIARGPVAAMDFIENLGTNGGGFFNANGAHPFQSPTPIANLLGMLAIAVLPASLTYTFGKMAGHPRAGWMLYVVMAVLFTAALIVCHFAESREVGRLRDLGVAGANLEGKETRFGVAQSVLTAVTTSNGATGSTNAAPDSLTPVGVCVPLSNMLLGEIVFGGLGTGLYSMVIVLLIGVFIAGLMTGRNPEYLGKKLGPGEIKLVSLFTLTTPIAVLLPTAIAVLLPAGLAGLTTNGGPHGFTEVLYAYASCCANNGQAMAGLSANTPFYNVTTPAVMMLGRFGLAIPALALAGRLARRRSAPSTPEHCRRTLLSSPPWRLRRQSWLYC